MGGMRRRGPLAAVSKGAFLSAVSKADLLSVCLSAEADCFLLIAKLCAYLAGFAINTAIITGRPL